MSQSPQVIQGLTDTAGSFIVSERLAAAASAIVPGMLVEETGGEVQEHSVAGGAGQNLYALSDLTTGGTIDDVYTVGATTRYGAAHAGQTVNGLVATAAPAIVDGDPLESAGDGTLRKLVAGVIVAYALANLTNVSGSNARLLARIA